MAKKESSKDAARQFFERRSSGLDRKARDLILKAHQGWQTPVAVTIIYEFNGEISLFRSHPGDGPWWSSVRELKAACGNRIEDMGPITQTDLVDWYNSQQANPLPASNQVPATHQTPMMQSAPMMQSTPMAQAVQMMPTTPIAQDPEDILGTSYNIFGSQGTRSHEGRGSNQIDESEDDDASIYSLTSETESSSSEDEYRRYRRRRPHRKTQIKSEKGVHTRSPKRPRDEDDNALLWSAQEAPQQPVFQPGYQQPQFNFPNGVNPAAVSSYNQTQNGANRTQNEPYNSNFPGMGLTPTFNDQLAYRSIMPDVPQVKKPRGAKPTPERKRRRSSRRRKTH